MDIIVMRAHSKNEMIKQFQEDIYVENKDAQLLSKQVKAL